MKIFSASNADPDAANILDPNKNKSWLINTPREGFVTIELPNKVQISQMQITTQNCATIQILVADSSDDGCKYQQLLSKALGTPKQNRQASIEDKSRLDLFNNGDFERYKRDLKWKMVKIEFGQTFNDRHFGLVHIALKTSDDNNNKQSVTSKQNVTANDHTKSNGSTSSKSKFVCASSDTVYRFSLAFPLGR